MCVCVCVCLMTVKSKLSLNNDVILCAYYAYHVIYIFTIRTFKRIVYLHAIFNEAKNHQKILRREEN